MTIYRIYSDEQPDTMFASGLVCSVVVVANSEQETMLNGALKLQLSIGMKGMKHNG
jgi:hypothetical protein